MADAIDPYAVLQVARGASADDIRTAYRKLARTYHPDVNPGDAAAEERFKQISSAYDILSDAKKRKLFDEFGTQGLRDGFNADEQRAYARYSQGRGGARGPHPGMDFDLGDMFGDFFGGRGAARGKGKDLSATVEISLGESIRGSEVTLEIPSQGSCSACGGQGQARDAAQRCADCNGSGKVQAVRGPVNLKTRCPHCQGTGQRAPTCGQCGGSGRSARRDSVTVRIPKGAGDGTKLRVAGRGSQGPAGPGDLVIETRIRPHAYFKRDGLDLHLRLPVTIEEAIHGTQVEVPDAAGTVKLRVPPGSQQGAKLRLKGRGVTRGAQTGHLYVEIDVRMPDAAGELDAEALAAALKALNQAYTKPVRADVSL